MGPLDFIASLGASIAKYKGYSTIQGMVENNLGLTCIMVALIAILYTLTRTSKTIPTQGNTPVRNRAYLLLVRFCIGAFIVVVIFAMFEEGKKIIKESRIEQGIPVYAVYNT